MQRQGGASGKENEAGCNVISRIIRRFSCGLGRSSEQSLPMNSRKPDRRFEESLDANSRRARENGDRDYQVLKVEERTARVLPRSRLVNSGSESINWHGNSSVRPCLGNKRRDKTLRSANREAISIHTPRNGCRNVRDDSVMGNILRRPSYRVQGASLGSQISAEALKDIGNEKYKQGKFKEALVLYDQAIALDASKATYRSNRSAALIGLGRLLEAISECKEAVRLDPTHKPAHNRLANLYIRLGQPEKALRHYSYTETIISPEHVSRVEEVKKSLQRCNDARLASEWDNLLQETDHAISSGVDSSPQVYAMKAEALLMLRKYQESFETYARSPRFGVPSCAKLFGPRATSQILTVEALVYLSAGRFDAASATSEEAISVDPSNKEAVMAADVVKGVMDASLTGDLQFNASQYWEACVMYSEGLIHDPYNPVLLCNRAACFAKLKLFSKAMDDYTRALRVQPNYSEARRRRADCCVQMEQWGDAIKDYVVLEKKSTKK